MNYLFISLSILLLATSYFVYQYYLRNKIKPIAGGVYSLRNKEGRFQIIKVLAISKHGFAHYLLYPSSFNYRPETLQISVMADRPLHKKMPVNKFYKIYPGKIGQIELNKREIQRYLKPKAS